MSFLSGFIRVDKLFKALTAPFFSSSPIVEQSETNNNPQSSALNDQAHSVVSFKTENNNMPGIVGENNNDINNKQPLVNIVDDDMVEEAEIWQNEIYEIDGLEGGDNNTLDQITDLKTAISDENDIYKCAADVLDGILQNITDSNVINRNSSNLSSDKEVEEEEETSTEFLDALSVVDDLSSNNLTHDNKIKSFEDVFGFGDGPDKVNNNRDLLELSIPNNSQLVPPLLTDEENNLFPKFYDELHSSTPINDENLNFDLSNNELFLKREEGFEISADSFETAASTMSEERPITGKGEYSLDFEQILAAGDAAVETIDPFGGRSSSKNKTFTRKSSKKLSDSVSASPNVDTNANDVEKTPKLVESENFETKSTSPTVVVEKQQPTEDINKNSDTIDSSKPQQPPIVENGVKSKDIKVSIDETPKKAIKRDVVNAKSPNARAQTAIVAPMINTNLEQQQSTDCSAKTSKPAPAAVSAPAVSIPKPEPHSDEEFVMASSDLFADPAALDYLQKAGLNAGTVDSDLYRQSLYVKFDPLIAAAASAKTQQAAAATAAPKKPAAKENMRTQQAPVPPGSNTLDDTLSAEETASADDDLLLMKTPSPKALADNQTTPTCPPTVVLKKKPVAQARANTGEVDNILTVSPKRQVTADSGQPETSMQQLKMQFQAYLMAKEKEWLNKYREEREKNERMIRELATVTDRSVSVEKHANEMKLVVAEYDKTIRDLTKQLEKSKGHKHDDYDKIVKEKEQALEDLQSVDNAFSELHRRYEKLRCSTEDFKKNEEKLRECIVDLQNKLKLSEEKFRKLKDHAEQKLESANAEIDKLQKAKENDTVALKALVKKRDLQVESLEKSVEQKQKEIQELSAICDELIQKVDLPQNTKNGGV